MVLGLFFFLLAISSGYAGLRVLGVTSAVRALLLAPPVGLAFLAVLTTWSAYLGLPPWIPPLLLGLVASGGALWIAADWRAAWPSSSSEGSGGGVLLILALGLTTILISVGFAGIGAPLSTHDGAHHVEIIDSLRRGTRLASWYPTGFHASMAAVLGLAPWIDTAAGAFRASLGLALLTLVAAFALAHAVWGSALRAGASALMIALTFQFPYQLQFWGGWPLGESLILALGVWTIALAYLERPGLRLAALGGLCAAAIVLVHGSEVYTTGIGLVVLMIARWRRLPWRRLGRDLPVALLTALGLAVPYLPTLFGWASTGGAQSVGEATAQAALPPDGVAVLTLVSGTLGTGLELDLPIRIGLLLVGMYFAARYGGALPIGLGAVFLGLAAMFAFSHHPIVDRLYADTFPWGQPYRLLMVVAVMGGLLQGAGAVALARRYGLGYRTASSSSRGRRPWQRLTARAIGTAVVVCSGFGLAGFLSINASSYASWSADDDAAMTWLRAHADPAAVVVNDGFADAGIWVPYKTGLPVLLPRLGAPQPDRRRLVADNIVDLTPAGQAAACDLGARYAFRGAQATIWDRRRFPPLSELEQSPALEEVFSSGEAAVFRLRLTCDAQA